MPKPFTKIEKEYILREYNNGKGTVQISRKLGRSKTGIQCFLKRSNIELKRKLITQTEKDQIIQEYQKDKPLSQISQQFSCSVSEIYYILRKSGIQLKMNALSQSEKDYIISEYQNGKSIIQISQEFSRSISSVFRVLLKNKIPIRGPKSFNQTEKDYIFREYELGKSGSQIARELNHSSKGIRSFLKRNEIQIRNQGIYLEKLSPSEKLAIKLDYENGMRSGKLMKKYPVSRSTIHKTLKNQGCHLENRVYSINEDYFNEPLNEEKAYWIGFLLADGSVSDNGELCLPLQEGDIGHLQKIKKALQSEHPICRPFTPNEFVLRINSVKIAHSLKKFEIFPRKTGKYSFPELPSKFHCPFLRGYIDGDGSLGEFEYRSRKYFFFSILGTPIFLEKARMIISNKLSIRIPTIYAERGVSVIAWRSRNDVLRLVKFFYKNSETHLDRKFKRAMNLLKKYPEQFSLLL